MGAKPMAQQQIIEGTWREVSREAEKLDPDQRVRLLVIPETEGAAAPEEDPTIALPEAWISEAPSDPKAIREAEADLLEFKRNMNALRKGAGARLLYPEAE
jgi:hypothetical protein